MFLGGKIRKKRLEMNLTQSELAENVCTQFTISNLERKNVSPSTEILTQLCLKLDLNLNELFTEFESVSSPIKIIGDAALAEQELLKNNFEPAKSILKNFDLDSAKSKVPTILYLWCSYIEVIESSNTDLAIFYSTQYSQNSSSPDAFESALFNSIMGIIYEEQKENNDLASFYFDKGFQTLIELTEVKPEYLPRVLFSTINIAKYYLEHDMIAQGNELLNLAISWNNSVASVYYMNRILELKLKILKKGSNDYKIITSAAETFKLLSNYSS